MLSGIFCGAEILHWIVGGLISGPFVVLLKALGMFFGGVDFCSHSIIPFNWNPDYPPPPLSWDFSGLDKVVLNSNTQLCLFPLLC